MEDSDLPALTVVLTKLHAGGKFGGEGYKVSGGLHGVGVSVVNALSEWLVAEVRRDGKVYRQEFARGVPTGEMKIVGDVADKGDTGTTITFLPDAEIFEEIELSTRDAPPAPARDGVPHARAADHARRTSAQDEWSEEFHYDGGIRDFVAHINETKDPIHSTIVYFEAETEEGRGSVEVAMQWNAKYVRVGLLVRQQHQHPSTAARTCPGFRAALTRTLNTYARRADGLLKEKDDDLEGEDVREGLAAVISVKLRDPQFEGQTKAQARQPRGRAASSQTDRQPKLARVPRGEPGRRASAIVNKAIAAARARSGGAQGARASAARARFSGGGLPGKLADCQSNDPERCELFIVEGDSAGGSAVEGPRPELPGDPAAARQDHQQREEPDQQGALEHRDPGDRSPRSAPASATSSTSRSSATTGSSS